MDQRPNTVPKTLKVLEQNLGGGNTLRYCHSQCLFGYNPKMQETKVNINKWGDIKLRCFCTSKEIINRFKIQPTEWEKLFVTYSSQKLLITIG
jgi:hypothetical protein